MANEQATKAQRVDAFKVAFITASTIFIMGYVNALALHTNQLAAMVTPQTGNVVWMGLNPAFGEWSRFLSNLALFFSFVFGCGFSFLNRNLFKNRTSQFFFGWALFALPVALFPFYTAYINSHVAFFAMGLSAGFGVGFFRQMYHLDINNAMATGSVRFLGVTFADAFVKKNKKEAFSLLIFSICVFVFALGAFLFGIMWSLDNPNAYGTVGNIASFTNLNPEAVGLSSFVNITLIVICILPCLCAPKNNVG